MERATRQREAIEAVFKSTGRPLSPAEVLEETRPLVEAMGLATVYRNLKRLVDEGTLQTVTLPGEGARFELAGAQHHHHFQCTGCRRVFDLPGCVGGVDRLAPQGFTVERHEVTLYGRCATCLPRAKRRRR